LETEESEMADIHKFSEQVIDLAERLGNVADAAQGKDTRGGRLRARWLLLPAAGAGIYALATSGAFKRQAESVVAEAKGRASDFPEALLGRVNEVAGSANGPSNRRGSTRKAASRSGSQRAKASSSRSRAG
jgi:hypothetical protein